MNYELNKQGVRQMFDRIAPTYDKLNHLMSLGIDRRWRRKAVDALGKFNPQQILDIATGTGDFALLMARRIQPRHITGADISEGMMSVGREKVKQEGLQDMISFEHEDCLNLSFPDGSFDAVTSAYGVRNFQDLDKGLREMRRAHAAAAFPDEATVLGLRSRRDAFARTTHQPRQQRLHLSAGLDGSFPAARANGRHLKACRLLGRAMETLHLRHQHNVFGNCPPLTSPKGRTHGQYRPASSENFNILLFNVQ